MRRVISDAMVTAIGALTLVIALVLFDPRVRQELSLRMSSHPAEQVTEAGGQLRRVGVVVFQAARNKSIDHAPLVFFALAGTVLVLFMLRV